PFSPFWYTMGRKGGENHETTLCAPPGMPPVRQLGHGVWSGADPFLFLSVWAHAVSGSDHHCSHGLYIGPPLKGVLRHESGRGSGERICGIFAAPCVWHSA